jgi:peptidoglycan/xylan/chitin deacetylase (PgdA/CDA1 family)
VSPRLLRWLVSLGVGPATLGDGSRGPACRLTIVRHHRIYANGERPLYRLGVSEEIFAAQLQMLGAAGLAPVTVGEGLRFLAEGHPGHRVAMSFDDGYADNITRALPHLVRHGAKATFFLTAGWMEDREPAWWDVLAHALTHTRRDHLVWDRNGGTVEIALASAADRRRALATLLGELRHPPARRNVLLNALRTRLAVSDPAPCDLATWGEAGRLAVAGMEVGAHTMNHPWLTQLSTEEQRKEIAGSVERIAQRLGVAPTGLAYPGGDHDGATLAVVRELGLAYAVTTRSGANGPGTPRLELKRRGLSDGACLGPGGRFSRHLAMAELGGAFDSLRGVEAAS